VLVADVIYDGTQFILMNPAVATTVGAASTSASGISERATNAEVVTGTDDTRYASPLSIASAYQTLISGRSYVNLYRDRTDNEIGDTTVYDMLWPNEVADFQADWASPTFTCRTSGFHRIIMTSWLFSAEAATSDIVVEVAATGQDYYAYRVTRNYLAGDNVVVNFAIDIPMTATNTFEIEISALGGTKTVDLDGTARFSRMSIEWIGPLS
jgi:hypothetical protein